MSTTSAQQGNQIAVTPAPGTGGVISVQALNTNCVNASSGPVNSSSKTLSVDVARPTPALTIISDKSPNGGNFTLSCGDQSDYHFRVAVGSIPAGGAFSNQAFQVSGPLMATGPLTGSFSVNTRFSGATGGAGITFRARYSRNGVATDAFATGVTITVQSALAPVSFTSLPDHLCEGETTTLRVSPVPGAAQYTWTLPGNDQLTTSIAPSSSSGYEYATTAPELTVTAHVNPYLYNYRVAVSVAAGSSACGSSSTTGTLVLGPAEQLNVFSPSQANSQDPYHVCANQPIQFSVTLDGQRGNVTGYEWQVNGTRYYPGDGATSINLYSPPAGQSLSVIATVHSPCGDLTRGVSVTSASSLDGQPCEAYVTGPPQPEQQAMAYPNPARNTLTLSQMQGPVTLYSSQGRPVRQASAPRKGQATQLDTHDLPAGLYHVAGRDAAGRPVRLQVQVAH